MGESQLHFFLKMLGMAYLYNQNCDLVATECYTYSSAGEKHDLDNHRYIDVLGLGKKFISLHLRRGLLDKTYEQVLRGVEVKISRSDFKNGFVTTGCNYHYLLTPMRLVNVAEIPKWIGLLEYNKHKFKIKGGRLGGRFYIEGLRIVKRPSFQDITKYQFQRGLNSVSTRLTGTLKSNLAKYFEVSTSERMHLK